MASPPAEAPNCGCQVEWVPNAPGDDERALIAGESAAIAYCPTHAAAFTLARYVEMAWREGELGLPVFGRDHDDVTTLLASLGRAAGPSAARHP